MSLSFGSKETSGSQNQTTNPWAPTMPSLQGFLGNIMNQWRANGSGAPSATQNQAFQTLENTARAGDPNAGAIRNLSTDMLNSGSWTPTLQDSYNAFRNNVTPMATADVDPTQAPGMADVLATIRNDITNNVNGQFAASGRDLSGMNQQTLARGIAQGEAVPLLNQYNQNVQNKLAANQALNAAGANTATTGQGLDAANAALRAGGIDVGNQALAAQNYAPNSLLTLEQQRLGLPFGNMGMLASLLYPMAGLGGQSAGNYNQSTQNYGVGASFNPFSWLGGK